MPSVTSPIYPSKTMFEVPETEGPFPMTYADNGQAYGHLALWETCHTGLSAGAFSECVRPPRSETGYSHFHLGQMKTAEGEMISVGKITLATGHAPMTADSQRTSDHYDNTGSVGAFVRAVNGQHGIWASGVVRSDISDEQLRDLRANPVSGDWRAINHRLELVAALAVPVPGFPIPMALAASGEVTALILAGPTEDDFEQGWSRSQRRQRAILSRRITAAIGG